jgi:hypothetical protein
MAMQNLISRQGFLAAGTLTVTPTPGNPYPQWMELVEKDGKLTRPRTKAWRRMASDSRGAGGRRQVGCQRRCTVSWGELRPADNLPGSSGRRDGPSLAGVRARGSSTHAEVWAKPRPLFNGKEMTGWNRSAT